jgi:hypothetical protein
LLRESARCGGGSDARVGLRCLGQTRVTPFPALTAADVERLSLPGKQIELVRGQLVVREPPGTRLG